MGDYELRRHTNGVGSGQRMRPDAIDKLAGAHVRFTTCATDTANSAGGLHRHATATVSGRTCRLLLQKRFLQDIENRRRVAGGIACHAFAELLLDHRGKAERTRTG